MYKLKLGKKILSLFLVLIFVFQCSTSAFAGEFEYFNEVENIELNSDLSNIY